MFRSVSGTEWCQGGKRTSDLLDGWQSQPSNLPPLEAHHRRCLLDQHLARRNHPRVDAALLPLDVRHFSLDQRGGIAPRGEPLALDCRPGSTAASQLLLERLQPCFLCCYRTFETSHFCSQLSPRSLPNHMPLAPRRHLVHLGLQGRLERAMMLDSDVSCICIDGRHTPYRYTAGRMMARARIYTTWLIANDMYNLCII